MRRSLSLLLTVLGFWLLVPGVLSAIGSSGAPADAAPVPAMGTSAWIGVALLVVAVLLWRRPTPAPTGSAKSSPS